MVRDCEAGPTWRRARPRFFSRSLCGSAVLALLRQGGKASYFSMDTVLSGPDSAAGPRCEAASAPPSAVTRALVVTLVLPDGMGDVAFGECAVTEVAQAATEVTWLRVYSTRASHDEGEALVSAGALLGGVSSSARIASRAFISAELFAGELEAGGIDELWLAANEVFLAPWIFGIYAHDEPILKLSLRAGRMFWVLSEYGRGVGPIHAYTAFATLTLPAGEKRHRMVAPS